MAVPARHDRAVDLHATPGAHGELLPGTLLPGRGCPAKPSLHTRDCGTTCLLLRPAAAFGAGWLHGITAGMLTSALRRGHEVPVSGGECPPLSQRPVEVL